MTFNQQKSELYCCLLKQQTSKLFVGKWPKSFWELLNQQHNKMFGVFAWKKKKHLTKLLIIFSVG